MIRTLYPAEVPNAADWAETISIIDAETGTAWDLTGDLVEMEVRDDHGCRRLYGSTSDGHLTLEAGVGVNFAFPASEMRQLCAGSYTINIRVTDALDGVVAEPLIATVPIIEGGYR